MAKTKNLNFRLSLDEMEQLKQLANDIDVPIAFLVRWACREWLERVMQNPPSDLFKSPTAFEIIGNQLN